MGDGSEMCAKGKLSMGAWWAHASDARTMAPTSARVIARGVVAPAALKAHWPMLDFLSVSAASSFEASVW